MSADPEAIAWFFSKLQREQVADLKALIQDCDKAVERLRITAQVAHTKHASFWPNFEECSVELCVNNRNFLKQYAS